MAAIPSRLLTLIKHVQEADADGLLAVVAARGRFTKETNLSVGLKATVPQVNDVGGGLSATLASLTTGEYFFMVCSPGAASLLGLADFPIAEIDLDEALVDGEA